MSKQSQTRKLTLRGIIIPNTKAAGKSNGAVGLPGSEQAPLSYIEMEGTGEL